MLYIYKEITFVHNCIQAPLVIYTFIDTTKVHVHLVHANLIFFLLLFEILFLSTDFCYQFHNHEIKLTKWKSIKFH